MGSPIQGGELISLVEIDQDFCTLEYGVLAASGGNRVKWSEQFDHSEVWVKDDLTPLTNVTANTEASPLSEEVTADTVLQLAATTNQGFKQLFDVVSGEELFYSVYVKAIAAFTYFNIGFVGTDVPADPYIVLNATTGAHSSSGADVDSYQIDDVGDGWFRVMVACTASATGSNAGISAFMQNASSGYTPVAGTADEDLFSVFGAMVLEGADGSYVATRTDCNAELGVTGEFKCRNTRATCQDSANYDRGSLTLKFAKPNSPKPVDEYVLPSLVSITSAPSKLATSSRLSTDPLGHRASVRVQFKDHPHSDRIVDKYQAERVSGAAQNSGVGYDPSLRGTFWPKWRARNPYYLGRPLRTIEGVQLPSNIDQVDIRNYIIESISGPDKNDIVTIEAKDPLKLLDDDRAQAPVASLGEVGDAGGINSSVTSIDLDPSGIGDIDYPAAGYIIIGSEVMSFTRSGDTLTVVRGQYNTVADSHDEGDTVQLCVEYNGDDVADIVYDLLVTYGHLPASYINLTAWQTESSLYIPNAYSALITKPIAVKKLLGELAEEAGFSIWWNEVTQKVKFSAVKQPGAGSLKITDDWIIANSLTIKDKPESRISQVWTDFAIIDPTKAVDDSGSYRSTVVSVDATAGDVDEYGQDAVRKIHARWIPAGGKAAVTDLNSRLLSRFRDIPREFSFKLPSYRADQIKMGDSHSICSHRMQDENGDEVFVDIRILSVEHDEEVIEVKAEELRFTSDPDYNPDVRRIIIDTDTLDVNFRTLHDTLFPSDPSATDDIELIIESDAAVGSTTTGAALDVGDWSGLSYNSLTIKNYGVVSGRGGKGGDARPPGPVGPAEDGGDGGLSLYTRTACVLINNGTIQGGGGGGGGGGFKAGTTNAGFGGGGGGGAGLALSSGGYGYVTYGADGTLLAGGAGGDTDGADGGDGGNPAQAGSVGETSNAQLPPGSGGAAGVAIDGDSYITYTTVGTIKGVKVN